MSTTNVQESTSISVTNCASGVRRNLYINFATLSVSVALATLNLTYRILHGADYNLLTEPGILLDISHES
jgi:hypothetical protein